MVDDFDHEFKHIVHHHSEDSLREIQDKVSSLDRELRFSHGGRPVRAVEPVVQRRLEELGVILSPGRLRQYAKSLSERMSVGLRIEIEDVPHLTHPDDL